MKAVEIIDAIKTMVLIEIVNSNKVIAEVVKVLYDLEDIMHCT